MIGEIAMSSEPAIKQVFVGGEYETDTFERKLFLARKQAENAIRATDLKEKESFYLPSLSSKTFIYKGMLTPEQVGQYFVDLQDPRLKSAISLVHSRFSTNTRITSYNVCYTKLLRFSLSSQNIHPGCFF